MGGQSDFSTQQTIAAAFMELLNEKKINKITVKEIMQKCNMSRQIFYHYFLDIYDLTMFIHYHLTQKAVDNFRVNKDFQECITITLTVFEAYPTFYRSIVGIQGQNSFQSNFFNFIKSSCMEHIGKKRLNEEIDIALNIYWQGVIFQITQWAKSGFQLDSKTLGKYFYECLPMVIRKYYD